MSSAEDAMKRASRLLKAQLAGTPAGSPEYGELLLEVTIDALDGLDQYLPTEYRARILQRVGEQLDASARTAGVCAKEAAKARGEDPLDVVKALEDEGF